MTLRQRLGKLIDAASLVIGAVAATMALLAHGGRFSPTLDILTHLAPLYLAGSMTAGLLALRSLGRRRIAGFVLAIAGASAAGALLLPEFLRTTGTTAPPNAVGQIKIIEFNVWRGNRHLPEVVEWLAAEKPDVVVLEESSLKLRDMIQQRTGWRGVSGWLSSTMVITPRSYLVMNRPNISTASRLTFVNATYASASGPFEVVGTHLDWPIGPGQERQRRGLLSVLAPLSKDRAILAGDFNSTSWSFARRADDRMFGLIRRDRALASWPAGRLGNLSLPWLLPLLPIDHVYAGPGWATVSVRSGPGLGSDHYPLIVVLAPVVAGVSVKP